MNEGGGVRSYGCVCLTETRKKRKEAKDKRMWIVVGLSDEYRADQALLYD